MNFYLFQIFLICIGLKEVLSLAKQPHLQLFTCFIDNKYSHFKAFEHSGHLPRICKYVKDRYSTRQRKSKCYYNLLTQSKGPLTIEGIQIYYYISDFHCIQTLSNIPISVKESIFKISTYILKNRKNYSIIHQIPNNRDKNTSLHNYALNDYSWRQYRTTFEPWIDQRFTNYPYNNRYQYYNQQTNSPNRYWNRRRSYGRYYNDRWSNNYFTRQYRTTFEPWIDQRFTTYPYNNRYQYYNQQTNSPNRYWNRRRSYGRYYNDRWSNNYFTRQYRTTFEPWIDQRFTNYPYNNRYQYYNQQTNSPNRYLTEKNSYYRQSNNFFWRQYRTTSRPWIDQRFTIYPYNNPYRYYNHQTDSPKRYWKRYFLQRPNVKKYKSWNIPNNNRITTDGSLNQLLRNAYGFHFKDYINLRHSMIWLSAGTLIFMVFCISAIILIVVHYKKALNKKTKYQKTLLHLSEVINQGFERNETPPRYEDVQPRVVQNV